MISKHANEIFMQLLEVLRLVSVLLVLVVVGLLLNLAFVFVGKVRL